MNKKWEAFFPAETRTHLLILFSLTVLVYANTWRAPFNFDDFNVIRRHIEMHGDEFFQFSSIRYRHLFHLSFVLNQKLGGYDPFVYHLTNNLIHVLNGVLVLFLAQLTILYGTSLGRRAANAIGFLTAGLFILHPIHTEAITYLSGRGNGLSGLFSLLSLYLFARGSLANKNTLNRTALYLFALVSFGAAVLSKETTIFLPLGVALYDLCFMRGKAWAPFRSRLYWVYLPLPVLVVGFFAKAPEFVQFILDWAEKINLRYALDQFSVLGYGLKLYFFPINQSFDYEFSTDWYHYSWPWVFATLAGTFVLFALILWNKKFKASAGVFIFGALWVLSALAPTNTLLPRLDPFSERNFYLPGFGLDMILATLIYLVCKEKFFTWNIKYSVYGLVVVSLLFCLSLLTIERNAVYRSQATLWQDVLEKFPEKARAQHNLAHFYLRNKQYDRAYLIYNRLAISKTTPFYRAQAHINLGIIYEARNNYSRAEWEFEKAMKLDSSIPTSYYNLASRIATRGEYARALELYLQAEDRYKKYRWGYDAPPELVLNIAKIYSKLGRWAEAEARSREFLTHRKGARQAYLLLMQSHLNMGRVDLAQADIAEVDALPELKAQMTNNLGIYFSQIGKTENALNEFLEAARLNPGNTDPHYNIGRLIADTHKEKMRERKELEIKLEALDMEIKEKNDLARLHLQKALELNKDPQSESHILGLLNQLN